MKLSLYNIQDNKIILPASRYKVDMMGDLDAISELEIEVYHNRLKCVMEDEGGVRYVVKGWDIKRIEFVIDYDSKHLPEDRQVMSNRGQVVFEFINEENVLTCLDQIAVCGYFNSQTPFDDNRYLYNEDFPMYDRATEQFVRRSTAPAELRRAASVEINHIESQNSRIDPFGIDAKELTVFCTSGESVILTFTTPSNIRAGWNSHPDRAPYWAAASGLMIVPELDDEKLMRHVRRWNEFGFLATLRQTKS